MRHVMAILLIVMLIALAYSPVWLPRVRGELREAAGEIALLASLPAT
jgi:hypothetical protein